MSKEKTIADASVEELKSAHSDLIRSGKIGQSQVNEINKQIQSIEQELFTREQKIEEAPKEAKSKK